MADPAVTRPLRISRRPVPEAAYDALPGSLDPVLRRVYAARRVLPAEVGATLSSLLPVGTLGGVEAAAELLVAARRSQAAILVVGDFDADGATAAALVVATLRAMGFAKVDYLVPNRFSLGYGFSPAVADLAAMQRPQIVITVDNGISSIEGVARATAHGIDVIITDHHLPGPELPAARAIINPNLQGEVFPSKALCGVGVAFYLMAALARALGKAGFGPYRQFQQPVIDALDLVALGTVADLVPLDANNRILVNEGLLRMRSGRVRPGLAALFAVAGRDPAATRSADLGFAIAPRLNAAGRLADMSLGIDCLLADDAATARSLAGRLDELNIERRRLQLRMQEEAAGLLDQLAAEGMADSSCLFDAGWHEGIVGLVAARMRERSGRPVVAFAPGGEEGMLKGSARSVTGIHIRDLIADAVARSGLSGLRFGGHAMAAGLSLPASDLQDFSAAWNAEVSRALASLDDADVHWTDGPLAVEDFNADLAAKLHFAGPWGQGFAEPLFDNVFEVLDHRLLKDAHLRLSLRHPDGGGPMEAIAFGHRELPAGRLRCLYHLGVNDYGGRRRQQLVVEHLQSA